MFITEHKIIINIKVRLRNTFINSSRINIYKSPISDRLIFKIKFEKFCYKLYFTRIN